MVKSPVLVCMYMDNPVKYTVLPHGIDVIYGKRYYFGLYRNNIWVKNMIVYVYGIDD
jgi:hypothetical protein